MSRTDRAFDSHSPQSRVKTGIALAGEALIAKALGGRRFPRNEAFDVLVGRNAIEVKTIVAGGDKITMHPESLNWKIRWARDNGYKPWTVVVDARWRKTRVLLQDGRWQLSL